MNVKKGDLAILMKSATDENVGKICEVLEYVGRHSWPDVTLENIWRVKFQEPVLVYLTGDDGKLYASRQTFACVADAWLMPIRPGEGEDKTDREIDEKIGEGYEVLT